MRYKILDITKESSTSLPTSQAGADKICPLSGLTNIVRWLYYIHENDFVFAFASRHGVLSMYNETLHDKTGSYIASVSANITQLSDGSIADIRNLFPEWNTLAAFCRAYVPTMTTADIDRILDQVYPELAVA